MKLREAGMQDISQIKEMYKDIVSEMEKMIYIFGTKFIRVNFWKRI